MIEGCRENPKSNLAGKWYFAFGKLFMLLCARKSSSGISIHYTASEKDSYLNIYPPIRTTSFIPQKNVQGLTSQPQFQVTTEYPFGMHPSQYNSER
jgi:hypothetical protein